MARNMKAIVFQKPGEIVIGTFKLGPCGPLDIVVKTLYSMVSSGTELRVLDGNYGANEKFPLIPGYSIVGEIMEIGEGVKGYQVGDLVSGRNPKPVQGVNSQYGAQASYHVYPTEGEDRPILLPQDAKPLDYVITEISAISFRGVEAAAPRPGETAIILGQGLIGAFSAAWLKARGCRVLVADVEQQRLDRALAWGASGAVNVKEPNALDRLLTLCNGGADIVVESSGTSTGVKMAYKLIRRKPQAYGKEYKVEPIAFYHNDWPRLVMQANYLEEVSIDPFRFFTGEGLIILTPSDRGIEDRQKTVDAIRGGTIRATDFVQNIVPFTDAAEAYFKLRNDKNSNFSVVFDWTDNNYVF